MTITFGRWQLRPIDERNFELFERRTPKACNATGSKGGGKPRWFSRKEYFQTLGQALRRVIEYEARDGNEAVDLREALDRYESIADRLLRAETAE